MNERGKPCEPLSGRQPGRYGTQTDLHRQFRRWRFEPTPDEGRCHDGGVVRGSAGCVRCRGRAEATDDYWGGARSIIRVDHNRFPPAATKGLDEFSHLEIVFRFHLTDPTDLNLGARRARDNPNWPEVGIFGHRNMRRVNWLGVSRCRLLTVEGLDLHVADLDAVDGTPVLDIKPWFAEMGPQGEVKQAPWSIEMLRNYYAPSPDE